jgi:exonuclease SbcC
MIIHSLSAKNLLKYAELELTDLPRRGLIAISGLNESGKSSIGETICFALYGRTFTLGEADILKVIRWGETQCSVKLRFGVDGGDEYEISRLLDDEGNHSARLCRSDQPDAPLARGAEAVEHALFRLLGYEYDEFIESFYLAQREITAPHPHSHAVKVMAGVAPLEYLAEQFDQEIGELDNELERLDGDQERILQELEQLGIEEGHLAKLDAELAHHQVKILGLKEQAQELESASSAYQEKLANRNGAGGSSSAAGFLRLLMLILAVVASGLWLALAQFPGEVPQAVMDQIAGLVPDWQEKLPWLLYAAAGFGVLFLLFWVRYSAVNARVHDFGEYAQVLADQLSSAREQFPYDAAAAADGENARAEPAEFDALRHQVVAGSAEAAAVGNLVDRELGWLRWVAAQEGEQQASVEALIREERDRLHQADLLNQELDACREQMAKRQHRIEIRELAGELLEGATRRISQRFNRNLRDLVARTLPLITENRYEHLQIGEDLSVRVFSSQKRDFIELDEISSGTQRQIMLAVRLALSQELVERTGRELQFLILDEPFAFFDDERARSSLAVLPELSEQIAQVWIIAQSFPQDSGFAVHLECARDIDRLVHGSLAEEPIQESEDLDSQESEAEQEA